MHLIQRQTCRACGSRSLTRVIDLGAQYLQGSFIKAEKEAPPLRKIACTLVRCDPTHDEKACGLLQMEHTVPPSILYSGYWYRSGTNQTMRRHLAEIAATAFQMVAVQNPTALDIGSNDGTLLSAYPVGVRRLGIDPSDVAHDCPEEIEVVHDLFPSHELTKVLAGKRCDIITSIAMFYDLEDPVGFCRNIAEFLATDGLWIFEMSYMPSMLRLNSYDTICHEHLEYYSLAVIEKILAQVGIKVVRAQLNDINGGSIRCYATHVTSQKFKNTAWHSELMRLRTQEFDLELDSDKPYRNFQDRINVHGQKLLQLLRGLRSAGKKIHVYGASTKGNTILQWCNIDSRLVDCAADRNPDKHGARTIGTDIPIVSEEESRRQKPDYYLVLPWHFADEFLEREKATLQAGTAMIFPLPEVKLFRWVDGHIQTEAL